MCFVSFYFVTQAIGVHVQDMFLYITWYTDVAYNMIIRYISVYIRVYTDGGEKHDNRTNFSIWYTKVAYNTNYRINLSI